MRAANDEGLARTLLAAFLTQEPEQAIVLIADDGRIVGWHAGAERVFGYAADEVLGQSVALLFTQEDRARRQVEAEFDVARRAGRAEDNRWHQRRDGMAIWVNGTLTALRASDGALIGFVKVMRDRTDTRVQVDTLEKRVEGLEKKLGAADLMLKTLGHEIRNPLGPLQNAVVLLQRQAGDAAHELPLNIVRRQIALLERLAEDLMDFTRLGTGKLALHLTTFDLNMLVREVTQAVQETAQARGRTLAALLADTPLTVVADRERMQQVLSNLIHNALKYTPAGGAITVRAVEETPHAVVRVEDDGVGISPDLLPRIFDLFTQGRENDGTTSGLGIGLAIAKDLVELHGGTIEARSPGVGKGAEFSVRIPTRSGPRQGPGTPAGPAAATP
jgi:PAS domain S-box-containing protein